MSKTNNKRPLNDNVAQPTSVKHICEEVRSSPAKKRKNMLTTRLVDNVKKQADAITALMANYNSESSSDEEVIMKVGRAALGLDVSS